MFFQKNYGVNWFLERMKKCKFCSKNRSISGGTDLTKSGTQKKRTDGVFAQFLSKISPFVLFFDKKQQNEDDIPRIKSVTF